MRNDFTRKERINVFLRRSKMLWCGTGVCMKALQINVEEKIICKTTKSDKYIY